MPACSLLCEEGELSSGAQIAIALSCAVIQHAATGAIHFLHQKMTHIYAFGLTQELMGEYDL